MKVLQILQADHSRIVIALQDLIGQGPHCSQAGSRVGAVADYIAQTDPPVDGALFRGPADGFQSLEIGVDIGEYCRAHYLPRRVGPRQDLHIHAETAGHSVENAVDEGVGGLAAVDFGELDSLVDGHPGGHVRHVENLG